MPAVILFFFALIGIPKDFCTILFTIPVQGYFGEDSNAQDGGLRDESLLFQMISKSDSGLSSSPRMCTRGGGLYKFSVTFKGHEILDFFKLSFLFMYILEC